MDSDSDELELTEEQLAIIKARVAALQQSFHQHDEKRTEQNVQYLLDLEGIEPPISEEEANTALEFYGTATSSKLLGAFTSRRIFAKA